MPLYGDQTGMGSHEEEWDVMTDTGFKGLFFCCQVIGSIMRQRGYGKIINLSSTFSRSIIKGRSVYGASKPGCPISPRPLLWNGPPTDQGERPGAHCRPYSSRQETLKGEVLQRILSRIPLGGWPPRRPGQRRRLPLQSGVGLRHRPYSFCGWRLGSGQLT